jgi:hypothetical protein
MDSPTAITDQTPKEKPVVITSSGSKSNLFKYSFVNPKFLGVMTVLLLMVGGVGAGVYLTQKPQQTTSQASLTPVNLNFKPAEIKIAAGSEFSIDVFTTAGDNQITGADLSIKFDPEVLTLKSITPKDFLSKILMPPKIASGSASISLGTDGSAGVSGSGVIASLLFSTKNDLPQTSSQITFDNAKTHIKILNHSEENTNNVFGEVKVSIQPAPSSNSSSPGVASSSAETSNAQDFNGDGQVNSIDLSLMYSAWGDPESDTQRKADVNGDGVVNGMDYSLLLPKFKSN